MRWQQIKYTKSGSAFVTFHGRRHGLDGFMKFSEPTTYQYKGKSVVFHGYKAIANTCSLLISLGDSGESARLFLQH